jgi:hypothetical protein
MQLSTCRLQLHVSDASSPINLLFDINFTSRHLLPLLLLFLCMYRPSRVAHVFAISYQVFNLMQMLLSKISEATRGGPSTIFGFFLQNHIEYDKYTMHKANTCV